MSSATIAPRAKPVAPGDGVVALPGGAPVDDIIVECRAASRTYRIGSGRPVTAVDCVDLAVRRSEFVAILGPSGSGKSTLLGLIAGLERADSGHVLVLGQDIAKKDETECARLRRRRLGIVFQSFGLVPSLNALQNVVLPLSLDGVSDEEQRRRGLFALLDVGLADRAESRIDDLSGGERQRVAIARALVGDPALLLADEPTGSLDEATSATVLDLLIRTARDRTAALVLVTHDAAVGSRADRRYAMLDGRLQEITTS